jgi:hypothetical protein
MVAIHQGRRHQGGVNPSLRPSTMLRGTMLRTAPKLAPHVGVGSWSCENDFRQGCGATLMQRSVLGHIINSPEPRIRFFCGAQVILFRVFTQPGSPPEVAVYTLVSAIASSSGHNTEYAYRRLVPIPDLSRCSKLSERYSITSSARPSSFGGMSILSALAGP